MKTLLITLLALIPAAAFAAPTQTLVCEARALQIGGGGKTGNVTINVTKINDDENDNAVTVTAGWNDAGDDILSAGKICGYEVPKNEVCGATLLHPGQLSYQIQTHCGKRFRTGSYYYYPHSLGIVLASDRSHGRLTCGNTGAVELANCR